LASLLYASGTWDKTDHSVVVVVVVDEHATAVWLCTWFFGYANDNVFGIGAAKSPVQDTIVSAPIGDRDGHCGKRDSAGYRDGCC